ncbi:MAG: diadenylate cyclase CdaA [Clostridia bacterium]|nr:diadenylate cyclase CdaA [Clostridia bacterium]
MQQEKSVSLWSRIVEFFQDYIAFPFTGQNFTFIHIIDILLLSALLYMVYKFIRDRHAGRIVMGFGLLIVIYVLSDVLGMIAINSIFKNFFTVGIIAVVVLFQPELREVLEEFGTTTSMNLKRIRSRYSTDDEQVLQAVDEICAAAFELSAKGEGALIVLERTSRLRNQMSEGTPIDAVVSRQLLCNIFVNKSPLHDGAVIIRNCRIVSASNKSKTISENDVVAEGLGTRHRAALKISEVSDAVVLVVSEETGTISIANNKLLKRHYNDIGQGGRHKSSDLRDDLFKLLTGKSVADMTTNPFASGANEPSATSTEGPDEELHDVEEIDKGGAEN